MKKAPVIAIVNSNPDFIDALRLALLDAGFASVVGHVFDFKKGEKDVTDFVKKNDPPVIIYDVAYPYEENWNYFKLLSKHKYMQHRQFVLTTTNLSALKKMTDMEEKVIEMIGKPFEMKAIIQSVEKCMKKFKKNNK